MNCTESGRSRPISCSSLAWRTGSMPRSPTRTSTGSPGTRWISRNARKTTPKKVGMTRLTRVRRNRSIRPQRVGFERVMARANGAEKKSAGGISRFRRPFPSDALLLDIHTFEDVGAQRMDLEADDLLAHRHIDDRVRDRDPGRVVMEDHLSLHIELGALRGVGGLLGFVDQGREVLVAPL